MHLDLRFFSLPKAGNAADENEDAFDCYTNSVQDRFRTHRFPSAVRRSTTDTPVRLAVADGATESSFSDLWAKLIARAFCRPTGLGPGLPPSDSDDAENLKQQSVKGFDHASRLWDLSHRDLRLPWYAEQKKEMGAFAAFIGLRVCPAPEPQRDGTWDALAAGDACLFHFRSGTLRRAFPIGNHEGFSNTPWLLSSKAPTESSLVSASGKWQTGDEFALATDALACWILHASSLGEDVAAILRSLCSQDAFATWVNQQRHAEGRLPLLRNDDVTLAWCCINSETDKPPDV